MTKFGRGTNLSWIVPEDEDYGYGQPGGIVKRFIADAALLIGDAVILNTATENEVLKSTTDAGGARVGIVVGGKATHGHIASDSASVGQAAAAANEEVLVCIAGICWGVSDGSVTIGAQLKINGAATAGRLDIATVTTNAGLIIGSALSAGASAGTAIRVLVHPA